MAYTRSFSPNGLHNPNPDYMMCGGAFHATTAAKIYSVYLFLSCLLISGMNFLAFGADKTYLSLFCTAFTIYSIFVMYGVFLEKKAFILPFLFIQGALTILTFVVTVSFACFGAFTNFIPDQHKNSQPLRDLYAMHGLDPDHENTQTVTASTVLFFLILNVIVQGFSWYVMLRTYKCYKDNDQTIVPKDGYNRGIIAESGNDYE